MGISTVPDFVPVDVATRLTALEASDALQTFMGHGQGIVSGGGVQTVDTSFYVKWSQRFILMGAGRSAATAVGGYFEISCPASGTIIGVGGATNKTVTAAGIPLNQWDALYYILPLGSPYNSVPANFRVVSFTSDYVVPPEWVMIAFRNGDGSGSSNAVYDEVFWCNGNHFTPWFQPTLLLGWAHYAAPYGPGRYRKYNGAVVGTGILSQGTVTVNSPVFTLPVGFRPAVNEILTASTSPLTGAPYYSEIRVRLDGSVALQTGINGYMSLANINFIPEA